MNHISKRSFVMYRLFRNI